MKVSIITVCFNSEKTIGSTIESVNDQSYQNIEHVFIDGLSSDQTLHVIKNTTTRENICTSEKDNGIYDAMNKGISLSSGDFIMFLNSDDIFHNNEVVEYMMSNIKKYSLDVVYGNVSFFKDDAQKPKRIWKSSDFQNSTLTKGFHPPHPGLLVSKLYFEKIGLFNTNYKIVADYDFIVRLFRKSDLRVKFIDTLIVDMKLGGASTTIKGIFTSFGEFIMVLKSNNYSYTNIMRILAHRYIYKIKQIFFR